MTINKIAIKLSSKTQRNLLICHMCYNSIRCTVMGKTLSAAAIFARVTRPLSGETEHIDLTTKREREICYTHFL
jgi:hypothetical protein